jgi:hypothetical protein
MKKLHAGTGSSGDVWAVLLYEPLLQRVEPLLLAPWAHALMTDRGIIIIMSHMCPTTNSLQPKAKPYITRTTGYAAHTGDARVLSVISTPVPQSGAMHGGVAMQPVSTRVLQTTSSGVLAVTRNDWGHAAKQERITNTSALIIFMHAAAAEHCMRAVRRKKASLHDRRCDDEDGHAAAGPICL